jgi:hypothetical protein
MSEIQKLILQFIQSTERSIQFDIYSRKQIVLQIYKRYDVKNWGYGIENKIMEDLVVELTFKKQKIDNDKNKERFLKSDLCGKFCRFDTIKEDSYWTGIDSKLDTDLIMRNILEIIDSVYDLGDEKVEFTLNAY